MADFGRNWSSMFQSATNSLHRGIDTSQVALPPAVAAFINKNYYKVTTTFTNEEIVQALNSKNEASIYSVLKYLTSLATSGVDDNNIAQFFPLVVKNVQSANYKIRRLVYILLIKYNEQQPDVALLSINAIQKSLMDKSPINRSMAIRCLSDIKIPAILPILLISLEKSIKDSSPLVRSAAAVAIGKCVRLDIEYNRPADVVNTKEYIKQCLKSTGSIIAQLYQFLDTLLCDNDPKVLSIAFEVLQNSSFVGFLDIFHNKIENLIQHFDDLDCFAQASFLDLMTDYSLIYFPICNSAQDMHPLLAQLYNDHILNLIYCPHGNVVLSAIRFVIKVLPFQNEFPFTSLTLKFTHSETEAYVFLNEIIYLISIGRFQIEDYRINQFYPSPLDKMPIFKAKIDILFDLITNENFNLIFNQISVVLDMSSSNLENKMYTLDKVNELILSNSLSLDHMKTIINLFMTKLKKSALSNDGLVSEYVTGLRQLIQLDLNNHMDILINLVGKMDSVSETSQSSILWLMGEFIINHSASNAEDKKVSVLVKYITKKCQALSRSFINSNPMIKTQILILMAKTMIFLLRTTSNRIDKIYKIWNYTLALALNDFDFDIRDQAILLSKLIPNVLNNDDVNVKSPSWSVGAISNHDGDINIDMALLIYQPSHSSSGKQVTKAAAWSPLVKFHKATLSEHVSELESYYDDLRGAEFELKDYNKFAKGISSANFNQQQRFRTSSSSSATSSRFGIGRGRGNGGAGGTDRAGLSKGWDDVPGANSAKSGGGANTYKLQSLDDFLGS